MNKNKTEIIIGFIIVFFFGVIILLYITINSRPYTFEMEGSCNSGKVNLNFDAIGKNEPYVALLPKYTNGTQKYYYLTEYHKNQLIQWINLKGIENINCNFKIKGQIPYSILSDMSK